MIQNFITFLCNPSNGNSLIFRDNKLADTATGKEFDCVGNVAILLEKSDENLPSSTTHEKLNTTFNYRDHYQKDAEFFNYFDKRQDRETTQENHRLHQTIWRTQKKHSRIVLDVGCGGGWVAKMALQEKLKVLSMDISTINPTEAVKRYNSPDHMGLVADAFHLPIKTNTIDTIIASEIMEHVADPKAFVASLYKALHVGGKLIITTPYNEKTEYSLCIHCNFPTPRHAHIHSFNEKNIAQLIPERAIWKHKAFSNFYLNKLRLNVILQWLPYPIWFFIDKTVNLILGKPTRLLIEIEKPQSNG